MAATRPVPSEGEERPGAARSGAELDGPLVAVFSTLLSGSFFTRVMAGARAAAAQLGVRLLAIQTLDAAHVGERLDDRFRHADERVGFEALAGAVLVVDPVSETYAERLCASDRPVVAIAHAPRRIACPVVAADNTTGTALSVAHLLAHGHRRIAFVGNLAQDDIAERYRAYCAVLRGEGIAPDPALVVPVGDNQETGGAAAAAALLAAGLPASAVVAATDFNALGLMAALQGAGVDVPGEVAVVGFDDLEQASSSVPALTTVRQDPALSGATAIRLVAAAIGGRAVLAGTYRIPTTFVPRASCGCPSLIERRLGGPRRPGETPRVQLHRRLAELLVAAGEPAAEVAAIRAAVRLLAELLEAPEQSTPARIDALARHVAVAGARFERIEAIVGAARGFSQALGADAREHAEPDRALARERVIADLALALGRASLARVARAEARLARSLRDEYFLSLDLLRHDHDDPRALGFLARTPVRAACLGLWADGAPGAEALRIVSAWAADGVAPSVVGEDVPVGAFPPRALVARADIAAGELVIVLPVRNEASDWGLLALVAPLDESATLGRDFYFQCAALLCAALDQEHLVSSLRAQQDVLRAQQRELRARQDELEASQEGLRRSEERYALAAEAASDGLWDLDVAAKTMYLSERCKQLVGVDTDGEAVDAGVLFDRVHPGDREVVRAALADCLAGGAPTLALELRLLARSGEYRWMRCRALPVPGAPAPATRLVGSLTDITEQRRLEQRLRYQAEHDALTGLPNRTLVVERLEVMLAAAAAGRARVAAVFIDLDNFKEVNDSLGHGAGDDLIVAVAARLSHAVRDSDVVGRLGGDEFVVLVDEEHARAPATVVAERVRAALRAPFEVAGRELYVSASIGVATSLSASAAELLRDADVAMYEAKSTGKDRYVVFEPRMSARAVERLRLESELAHALSSGELRVAFLPTVALPGRDVVGLEALVRWAHPVRGLLAPAEFLATAEASGRLSIELGRFVLAEACRAAARWQRPNRALGLSVNVSARQFDGGDLLADVADALALSGLAPGLLTLEIPERLVVGRSPRLVAERLRAVKALGVRIALDDFGSAPASLLSVRELAVDAVKIDRSVVAALGTSVAADAVLEALVRLARTLGVEVVAEGVEAESCADALALAGCALAQGYLFAPPLRAEDVEALVLPASV